MVMAAVAGTDNLVTRLQQLGIFVGLNFAGQATHLVFCMLSVVIFCKNPFNMLKLAVQPYSIAFATTSA